MSERISPEKSAEFQRWVQLMRSRGIPYVQIHDTLIKKGWTHEQIISILFPSATKSLLPLIVVPILMLISIFAVLLTAIYTNQVPQITFSPQNESPANINNPELMPVSQEPVSSLNDTSISENNASSKSNISVTNHTQSANNTYFNGGGSGSGGSGGGGSGSGGGGGNGATSDTSPPTFNSNNTNITAVYTNTWIMLFVNWTDNIGLNYTWSGNNFTGTWINETPVARAGLTTVNHTNSTQDTVGDLTNVCWQAWANDTAGNLNQTGIMCLQTGDTTPPTYASNNTNVTSYYNGTWIKLFVNWNDNLQLNYTWIGSNFSGTWINETPIARAGLTTVNHTNSTLISAGYTQNICWIGYANDTKNHANRTGMMCYITGAYIDNIAPTYTSNNTNITAVYTNTWIKLFVNWTDDIGLNYTWSGNNFTGNWINETPVPRAGFISINHTNSTYITLSAAQVGCYQFYANDTTGNLNSTTISCLMLESCSDTDGGLNYSTQGNATGYLNNAAYNYQDYCHNSTLLTEYSCSGNYATLTNYTCTYGCANGYCLCSESETCDGLDNDCDGFIDEGLTGCALMFVDEKSLVLAKERRVCSLINATVSAHINGSDDGESISAEGKTFWTFGDSFRDDICCGLFINTNAATSTDTEASDCISLTHKQNPSGYALTLMSVNASVNPNEFLVWATGLSYVQEGYIHTFYWSVEPCTGSYPPCITNSFKIGGMGLAKFNTTTLNTTRIHNQLIWNNSQPNINVSNLRTMIYGGYIYMFFHTRRVGRVLETKSDLEDPANYRYWNGTDWGTNVSQSADLWELPEPGVVEYDLFGTSVRYNAYLNKFVSTYSRGTTTQNYTLVVARTAESITGPWSNETVLIECLDYVPESSAFTCYSVIQHDEFQKNSGQTLFFGYSANKDYKPFLHELNLAVPIYQWMNYTSTVAYRKKGSSGPSGFINYSPVFYALEYSATDFSPIYEYCSTLNGTYIYSNSDPGADYANQGTAFYAPLTQLTNYSPVYRWEKNVTNIYSLKSGLESLSFVQKELAFYAKAS